MAVFPQAGGGCPIRIALAFRSPVKPRSGSVRVGQGKVRLTFFGGTRWMDANGPPYDMLTPSYLFGNPRQCLNSFFCQISSAILNA